MNITRFVSSVLLVTFIWITGCATHPDPLAGWQVAFKDEPNQTVEKDYQGYIQKLSADERKYINLIEYFKDGTGQHAIKITIGLNGTVWEHFLIYDKDNKRIKTITKHTNGGYRS
jgi:hypothetical protein